MGLGQICHSISTTKDFTQDNLLSSHDLCGVTGRPTVPRDEKKNRFTCGFTWLTILKLTLKWRFSAFRGMSVLKLKHDQLKQLRLILGVSPTCHLSICGRRSRESTFHQGFSS